MISCQAHVRWALVGAAMTVAALVGGCGGNYRPVISSISSSGPASQITSYVVAVTSTGSNADGVVSIIDYSGDSVMAQATIGLGPTAFTLDESGSTGYTLNSDNTLSNFSISTSLQTKSVSTSTLSSTKIVNFLAPSSGLWATDLNGDVVDIFSGSPEAIKNKVSVAATMPMFIAGSSSSSGTRQYVISQNVSDAIACNQSPTTAPSGTATPIMVSTYTTDTPITVGKCPVFAVPSTDQNRVFVLNRGDDTISVINNQSGALDSCTPFQNESGQWVTCHPTIQLPAGSGPVFAVYNATTEQLIVSNYDGGTISVIDVPLDKYGNDSNNYSNSTCIASGDTTSTYAGCGSITGGFGATIRTISVGNTTTPNPASVAVLYDGTKAYTANQNDDASGSGNGTVSVVNLSSYTLEKTLTVTGHPRSISATQNSEYNKVYVASPDSDYLTIIKSTPTETDVTDTTLRLSGQVLDLRVTTENGSNSTLSNYSSRVPGYGQPCNLPGSTYTASLTACQALP